jgi:hypothetical protein
MVSVAHAWNDAARERLTAHDAARRRRAIGHGAVRTMTGSWVVRIRRAEGTAEIVNRAEIAYDANAEVLNRLGEVVSADGAPTMGRGACLAVTIVHDSLPAAPGGDDGTASSNAADTDTAGRIRLTWRDRAHQPHEQYVEL